MPDGYAVRYAADLRTVAAAFVALERRCYALFPVALDVQPAGGPLWLRITDRDGATASLDTAVGLGAAR